ncbi:Deoxyribodipyrimidine photo-lyase [Lacunisphaera limnophila]|uniref:Deoxyribodipyrimidine photo-lyase n=1 Tax=Lacunisphaera limnophila TaxID=1838286 RepID=A0A1D8AZ23_9BACT|nr:deoxyribodipyrimidine photo-lyase [Lacunisphaera limnophila]AOS46146.1 Deoxyribodipyrimidine photo-lyase [Lacunisphaera limnophila]
MTSAATSTPQPATLVWFRQDLRVQDNPALAAAVTRGRPVIPVYILDDAGEGRWPMGGASRWWLHHSLAALDQALRSRGSRLVLARGESGAVLRDLIKATGADAVYWNRRYEPAVIARDKGLKAGLDVEALSFNSALLFEPHTIRNKAGAPFQVFTPFWKHCLTLAVEEPVKLRGGDLPSPMSWPRSLELGALGLLPKIPWDGGFAAAAAPGEAGAMSRLKQFTAGAMDDYADRRNRPDVLGTSALSAHLHFGDIGPRQIWAAVKATTKGSGVFPPNRGAQVFLSEVGWREFAHHLLFHFPHTPEAPLRMDFAAFPWVQDSVKLRAWQQGRTGYPIVDAGMRQLWATGWMHNRVRMIVASFLVKHLRISWQAGADWFWDTLVDADLASNTLGWQWTAGCGADAAPYFRIFNPILQGLKFDPEGDYVRRWVPELARLPAEFIHQPWEAPMDVLASAGVTLGRTYPHPLVDHGEARDAALAALATIRRAKP